MHSFVTIVSSCSDKCSEVKKYICLQNVAEWKYKVAENDNTQAKYVKIGLKYGTVIIRMQRFCGFARQSSNDTSGA